MMQKNPKVSPYYFLIVVGIFGVVFSVIWLPKIRSIQQAKVQIADLETRLREGQNNWRQYPPLPVEEIRNLKAAKTRLVQMLPKDRDIPPLLQDISRLARDHGLVGVTLEVYNEVPSSESQSQAAGVGPKSVVSAAVASHAGINGEAGPIGVFGVKVGFLADYRQTAYFLEGLDRLPRLVRVQDLKLQRSVPLTMGEIFLYAFYQKGDLPKIAGS